MKATKYIGLGTAIVGLLMIALASKAATSVFYTFQGGTGTSTPSGLLYGDNGGTTHLNTATIGSGCTFSGGTLSCSGTGLATTSVWTAGQLVYVVNNGTITSVATSSATCSSGISCTPFTVVGTVNPSFTNSGVTSITAGSGIQTSGSTGAVTVTNAIGYAFPGFNNSTTTLTNFNGNASTTAISATQGFFGGSATTTITSTGTVGIGTSTPFNALSFGLASSSIGIPEYNYGSATSTSEKISCLSASQTHFRIGTSATTLQIDASSLIPGQKCIVVVENPNASAGAITWTTTSGLLLWAGGTTPTQTTTANKMDVWSFLMTQGSSTNALLGAQSANF